MADKKITQLTALGATPAGTDIIPMVDDPGGTPVTKKVTVTNLMGAAPVQSVNSLTGSVTIDAGNLNDFNFDGNSILGYDASINAQTGTTYEIASTDAGKVITLDNASAIIVDVPSGLGANFNCTLVQLGAGQVTIQPKAASGVSINSRSNHDKIAGQYGVASLLSYADTTWILAGDTSA
jgi:hypothetical protein